jgi:sRNA-binding regulator protein Hfq
MKEDTMANVVRGGWFGRQVSILLVNGKTISGEVSEVTEHYVVLTREKAEVQIMGSAIVLATAAEKSADQAEPAESDAGPALFE